MVEKPLVTLALAFYLVATAGFVLRLTRRADVGRWLPVGFALGAVVLHAGFQFSSLVHEGRPDLHFFAALSLVSLAIVAVHLVVMLARPVDAIAVLVLPLAAACLVLAAVFFDPTIAAQRLDWQIQLHALFALVAFAVLSIAALIAITLWFQERALRQRQLGPFLRGLPPLTLVEALLFQLIAAGFLLLTLTLLSGALFVENLFGQNLAHKTVLSIVAWLTFGALLFGRFRYGWRGRRAVRMTLSGMAVLLLAYFGSMFIRELVLGRIA